MQRNIIAPAMTSTLWVCVVITGLMTSRAHSALQCLNSTHMAYWRKMCNSHGHNSIVDTICKPLLQYSQPHPECFSLSISQSNSDTETLRQSACSSIKGMVTWKKKNICSQTNILDCLNTSPYYSQYREFLPGEVESQDFIYSFCRAGPPFSPTATINDTCLEMSTKHCWKTVVLEAKKKDTKRFCSLLLASFKCHKKFLEDKSECESQRSNTIEFIRQMHQLQRRVVCQNFFLFHDQLFLPVGMMRYYYHDSTVSGVRFPLPKSDSILH